MTRVMDNAFIYPQKANGSLLYLHNAISDWFCLGDSSPHYYVGHKQMRVTN